MWERKIQVFRRIGSILWCSSEPIPEAPEPGTIRTRVGVIQPGLPPPSETDGATGKEQKDKRDERHPECRGCVGDISDPMLDDREEGDVDRECDEGEDGSEEGRKGSEEGDSDVGGEREEESNE